MARSIHTSSLCPLAAGAYDDDDNDVHEAAAVYTEDDYIATATSQYKALISDMSKGTVKVTPHFKANPGRFWLWLKKTVPDRYNVLTEVMLMWMSFPITTATIERWFSALTLLALDKRRGSLSSKHALCDLEFCILGTDLDGLLVDRVRAALKR